MSQRKFFVSAVWCWTSISTETLLILSRLPIQKYRHWSLSTEGRTTISVKSWANGSLKVLQFPEAEVAYLNPTVKPSKYPPRNLGAKNAAVGSEARGSVTLSRPSPSHWGNRQYRFHSTTSPQRRFTKKKHGQLPACRTASKSNDNMHAVPFNTTWIYLACAPFRKNPVWLLIQRKKFSQASRTAKQCNLHCRKQKPGDVVCLLSFALLPVVPLFPVHPCGLNFYLLVF